MAWLSEKAFGKSGGERGSVSDVALGWAGRAVGTEVAGAGRVGTHVRCRAQGHAMPLRGSWVGSREMLPGTKERSLS